MLMRCSLLLTLACALTLPAISRAAAPITIESLLHEMTDRDALARFPQPSYTCAQSSSYDRDSVSPNDGKSWFANWDRSQFVRIEENNGRKEYVLHDQDGPGALVRFWATWHGPKGKPFSNGTLRVYIDGAEKPAIEGSVQDVIDSGLLCGEPLSKGVSPKTAYAQRGHNLYLPIPYAKHCKVTYSTEVPVDKGGREGEALYYQINYRTYGKDVEVESFSMDRLAAARSAIEATNKTLASGAPKPTADWRSTALPETIAPKSQSEPVRITGPGVIRSMQVRLEADNLEQALRSTVLEIRFDGERTVWAPLGDFMGTGYVVSPFQTWYCSADKEGTLRCSWVMPFESEAEIVLHNLGDQEVRLADASVYHTDWNWDDRSMHFHSTWKQLTEVETPGNKNMDAENAEDVNYVTVQGEGVYVGDTLTLCNGAASWWGEGDEKIYVDGESFPSHFGTGTEDYYGYAWCRPESFESPLHAQPNGDGNLKGGYSVNSRYRALDAIPFKESLKFDMELWHWAATKINYAPTTFWYAKPGATCNIEPAPEDAARPVAKAKDELAAAVRVDGTIAIQDRGQQP
ncbi:glycoside hydrolase family 172 protein [Aeoliella sp. SH292]|uniref:glycoside hydrolase family 172 protein n=1 Tax=Aeoliella sp. SH292 TaxID=3454464 RepID=UPI003F9E3639